MGRTRTFIGLEVGERIRDRAMALQDDLAQSGAPVKWVEEENVHLTLLFLGEVDDRDLVEICHAVSDVAKEQSPFSIRAETLGCFPNMRRPKVVWIGITDGKEEVVALHKALEEPLLDLGCYRREARQYTPHITLGRLKGDAPTESLADLIADKSEWKAGDVNIEEVCVFSSELTPQGPVYTVISRGKLLGSPAS